MKPILLTLLSLVSSSSLFSQATFNVVIIQYEGSPHFTNSWDGSYIEHSDSIINLRHNIPQTFTLNDKKDWNPLEIKGHYYYDLSITGLPSSQDTIDLDTVYVLPYNNIQDGGEVPVKFLGIKIGTKYKVTGDVPNPAIKKKRVKIPRKNGIVIYRLEDDFKLTVEYDKLKK